MCNPCSNVDCRSGETHEDELLFCEGVEDSGIECGIAACESCQWRVFRFINVDEGEPDGYMSPRCEDCYTLNESEAIDV